MVSVLHTKSTEGELLITSNGMRDGTNVSETGRYQGSIPWAQIRNHQRKGNIDENSLRRDF